MQHVVRQLRPGRSRLGAAPPAPAAPPARRAAPAPRGGAGRLARACRARTKQHACQDRSFNRASASPAHALTPPHACTRVTQHHIFPCPHSQHPPAASSSNLRSASSSSLLISSSRSICTAGTAAAAGSIAGAGTTAAAAAVEAWHFWPPPHLGEGEQGAPAASPAPAAAQHTAGRLRPSSQHRHTHACTPNCAALCTNHQAPGGYGQASSATRCRFPTCPSAPKPSLEVLPTLLYPHHHSSPAPLARAPAPPSKRKTRHRHHPPCPRPSS